ncbi:MAG: hypothetical protein J0L88_09950 [Xanthomonadales bacterium]|nr:hypothetical protein [Xanthomonadales bacterium]
MSRVRRVEAILRRWDPIGVGPGSSAPSDEYDGYALRAVSMVEAYCTVEQLADFLQTLCTETIGVDLDRNESASIASQIIEAVGPSVTSQERTRGS